MKFTGTKTNKRIKIENKEQDYFYINPFIPQEGLIKSINTSLETGWPLLITGERFRTLQIGKALAFELYGHDFSDHFIKIQMREGLSFRDLVYIYDHEMRKRDLEYHSLDPENNPVRPPDYYLQTGPLIEIIKLQNQSSVKPILEINDLHYASPGFFQEFMDFMLTIRKVRIHETNQEFLKGYVFPVILFTAEEGFELTSGYDGIIYTHTLAYPAKDHLLEEVLLLYQEVMEENKAMNIKEIIKRTIDLFYLLKDTSLLTSVKGEYPTSTLELYNAIDLKLSAIFNGHISPDQAIAEIKHIIEAQYSIGKSLDVKESIGNIIELIKKAELKEALNNLELIQQSLPKTDQSSVETFISRFNEIKRIELMGTESSLILWPQKNKLIFDLLNWLNEFK